MENTDLPPSKAGAESKLPLFSMLRGANHAWEAVEKI
jgi:hypothetical protein